VLRNPFSFVGLKARYLPVVGLVAAVATTAPALAATASSSASAGPLAVSQSINAPAVAGSTVRFTLSVQNTTASNATDVFLGAQLPAGATLSGPLPNPNLCAKGGAAGTPAFTCLVGTLGALGTATDTFSISYSALLGSTAGTNHVVATGFANGAFTINSTDLLLSPAAAPTDLQLTAFASSGSPSVGGAFVYVFQVKNAGSHVATNVKFSDTLPTSVTPGFAASTRGQCDTTGGSVTCALGDIAGGSQALVLISANAGASGTFVNTGKVTSDVADTNPNNNSANVSIRVR
jgi:uncharacterized repeat protein (TIGR01451 family)